MLHTTNATNASVEWVLAQQVKLTGQGTFVQEVTEMLEYCLLARSRRRTHGDPPNTSFPVELCEAINLTYTTNLPRNSAITASLAVPMEGYMMSYLMTRVTRPVATY